jgi:F-type H+-transporting ATPase subunit delta
MANETIARRYATALADVVLSSGDTESVKNELAMFSQLFLANEDLQTVFGNPAIPAVNKEKVLNSLVEKAKPSKTTANFLRVLLRNGRLTDLAAVNERFDSVLQERRNIVSAEIVSARELPADERREFELSLEKLTGKEININFAVDPDLIGGVVTRIGSTVYDGSVRTKLENLKEQLVNG